jgi:hypothetical protein
MTRLPAAIAIILLAAACGGDDEGEDEAGDGETYTDDLTKEEEVPLCDAAGEDATGSSSVTVSDDRATITVELSFSGLSGPATAAHIHYGDDGVAGGVIFPLGMNPVSPVTASFTAANYPATPPMGAPAAFADFVADLQDGKTYINVHTAACMPGEIRGQIE